MTLIGASLGGIMARLAAHRLGSGVVREVITIAAPLPMPATAIWSPSDGFVNGRACYAEGEPGLRVIEIKGGQIGVHFRAKVLRTVAGILAG